MIETGLQHVDHVTVEDGLLTDVRGTLSRAVLSTPSMVRLMERAAQNAVLDHLEPGTTTVGFEICIKHVAAAPEGAVCAVRAVLTEVRDGRKLRFDVEVTDGERLIGTGHHERRVIPAG